jgi:hypothetical protein
VWLAVFSLASIGCGGNGSGDGAAGSGATGSAGGTGGTGGADLCAGLTCDDGNACTADTCDPSDGTCIYEDVFSNACRTQIEVDFPPRGASLQGDGADATVVVTGTVRSGVGEIDSFTLNGTPVTVSSDGSFSQAVDAQVGGNTLVFNAEDNKGNMRSRVQSFLWSTGYRKPTAPKEGIASNGLGIWLGQSVLDDGRAPPSTDFAAILDLVLEAFDLSTLIDSSTPIASQAGYDIYASNPSLGSSSVKIDAIDGGLALEARLGSISGDLTFDCTEFGCVLLGGDSTGDFSVSSVLIRANALLSVTPDNTLAVTLSNVSTTVGSLDINSDNGWTNFLLGLVEGAITGSLVADLEDLLENALSTELQPLLEQGLSGLAFDFSIDLPRLGSGDPISIDILTDFESVAFRGSAPKGGVIVERGGAYSADATTPYDNLGVPNRDRCGQGGQVVSLPKATPLEIGLSDDLLNQIFYAAWRAGWLEVEAGPELLGAVDLGALGVSDLQITLSGWLAPTVSDCNPEGALRVHLGDLQITGGLSLGGEPVTFTAYSSLEGNLALGITQEGLGIGLAGIDRIDTELTIQQDAQLGSETLLRGLLESALVNAVEGVLGGGGLGTVPLPQIDLSSGVGLPPASAVIEIMPQSVERADGVTVIGASP